MPDIVRRDPFDVVDHQFGGLRHAMERLFDDSFFRWPGMWDDGSLPVDVSEHDGNVIVKASLPGFTKNEIDVQLDQGVLSIKAEHDEEHEERKERYYRRERRYGAVARRIALPGIVGDAEVQAELKDGVLTLTVPLPESAKPKQIEIKTSS